MFCQLIHSGFSFESLPKHHPGGLPSFTETHRKEDATLQHVSLSSDCCFFEDCPFLADLMCNESSCQPFLNMTVCEFPEPGSVRFPSTVQGRMVRWTFQHWRKSSVTLLDEDSQILSINKLNESAKWKSEQAVCECLQDFAEVILRKKFIASCVDLPQPVAEYKESKDLRRHGAFLAPAQL